MMHGNHWKGGRRIDTDGYVEIYQPDHARARGNHYVYEHILVAEHALGRTLPDGVVVHHFDENKQHNTNNNLVICEDENYHRLLHLRARAYRAIGDPTARKCQHCQKWDHPTNLNSRSQHRTCYNAYAMQRYYARISQ